MGIFSGADNIYEMALPRAVRWASQVVEGQPEVLA
jgi:hypothetical protein